tara:strand:- start:8732 stop:9277 length:546 start_codon:yes stop_codon:yes gene_type:complete
MANFRETFGDTKDAGERSKESWGTFWDTHIGREGFFGNLGMNWLWKSGSTKDAEKRARDKIKGIYGDAIGGTEDYMDKLKSYYEGEGGLLARTRDKQVLSSAQPATQLQNLEDTMYSKGDMANIEKTKSPDWGSNLYAAADLGMSNSILGQKFQMNAQVFNLEEKIKQLEIGRENKLDSMA